MVQLSCLLLSTGSPPLHLPLFLHTTKIKTDWRNDLEKLLSSPFPTSPAPFPPQFIRRHPIQLGVGCRKGGWKPRWQAGTAAHHLPSNPINMFYPAEISIKPLFFLPNRSTRMRARHHNGRGSLSRAVSTPPFIEGESNPVLITVK